MPTSFRTARACLAITGATAVALCVCFWTAAAAAQSAPAQVTVDWSKTKPIATTPTLQVVVNPMLERGAKMHDGSFTALHALGADFVRYVPWEPYPKQAVAELEPPANGKTSWDFSHIDPTLEDFMKAVDGHSVVMNFSTIPAWMFKTDKPVVYPQDPEQVVWNYTQGTELRDPSMKEVSAYFARLLSWYTRGGFTDEAGKYHASGHHYRFQYWEVLNEIDIEHHWTPETYTRFYDAVTAAMLKVDPDLKFVGLALAFPGRGADMFEYFLNPAHHAQGAPPAFISYHFYASPTDEETIDNWQYAFFDQADGFLNSVRFTEAIRKRLSPSTKTDLDELGVILPEDGKEIDQPGYVAKEPPPAYWNLAGALYAYLYVKTANLGIDVIGESQLVGYHTQYPSVSMMDYNTSEPNARYWVLKLIHDNFGPADALASSDCPDQGCTAQAFQTQHGKKLLLVNKRNRELTLHLPKDATGGTVTLVAPSTGDHAPANGRVAEGGLKLEPFEVAVVAYP